MLERHGEVEGRQVFLKKMGSPPYATVLGSAETVRIFEDALPKPPAAPVVVFHPPAVADPEGRDRWQVLKALLEHGVRPDSLADSVLRLIEAGWSSEDAIEWSREEHDLAIRSGNGLREPWVLKSRTMIADARRQS